MPICSALAAQDSGSARQAIRLLREAGELAQAENNERVTEDDAREAKKKLEKNQLHEGMQELTPQGHAVLCTVAYQHAKGEVPVRSRDLYEQYVNICNQLDTNNVGERRVRDHLSDLNMLGIIQVFERNKGLSAGRYHEYDLDVPLDSVLNVLFSSQRFKDIAEVIQSAAGTPES